MSGTLLVVGNGGEEHVGRHFRLAAENLGLASCFADTRAAYAGVWRQRFNWRFRDRRPARLTEFSSELCGVVRAAQASVVLATGIAPIEDQALREIRRSGVKAANFLTDDPWARTHRAGWFLKCLPEYDVIFTPRRSNIEDLRKAGCKDVRYLPFAYSADVHYREAGTAGLESQVLFAGAADEDRLQWIEPLIRAGFKVALYGSYWHRYSLSRPYARGLANLQTLRQAVASADVVLGLVRRANRDGHCMRSYEAPAMGACLVAEKTEEHLELFGPDGESVSYFEDRNGLVSKVAALLKDPQRRRDLAHSVYTRLTSEPNRYEDRLRSILSVTCA